MEVNITYSNDDIHEAVNALKVTSWISAMFDLDQYLRSEAKYNEKRTEKEIDIIYEIREKLNDLMHEYNISFDE
jgi:hypothetical protein